MNNDKKKELEDILYDFKNVHNSYTKTVNQIINLFLKVKK